jgi:hypothetical protein
MSDMIYRLFGFIFVLYIRTCWASPSCPCMYLSRMLTVHAYLLLFHSSALFAYIFQVSAKFKRTYYSTLLKCHYPEISACENWPRIRQCTANNSEICLLRITFVTNLFLHYGWKYLAAFLLIVPLCIILLGMCCPSPLWAPSRLLTNRFLIRSFSLNLCTGFCTTASHTIV